MRKKSWKSFMEISQWLCLKHTFPVCVAFSFSLILVVSCAQSSGIHPLGIPLSKLHSIFFFFLVTIIFNLFYEQMKSTMIRRLSSVRMGPNHSPETVSTTTFVIALTAPMSLVLLLLPPLVFF